jgi:phosphate starvation-inducible PhoH-like protein
LPEKAKIYELPYFPIVAQLYGIENAYGQLKAKGSIEFSLSSFLRGITFDDSIIVVDEIQNMAYQELGTIITRAGVNTRLIMCGDTKQDDLTSERFKETSGLREFMQIISKMNQFTTINFTHDDIVRSELVKDFIIARDEFEMAA